MGKVKFEMVDGVLTVVEDTPPALVEKGEDASESFSMNAQRIIHLKPEPKPKPVKPKPVAKGDGEVKFTDGLGWMIAAMFAALFVVTLLSKVIG